MNKFFERTWLRLLGHFYALLIRLVFLGSILRSVENAFANLQRRNIHLGVRYYFFIRTCV